MYPLPWIFGIFLYPPPAHFEQNRLWPVHFELFETPPLMFISLRTFHIIKDHSNIMEFWILGGKIWPLPPLVCLWWIGTNLAAFHYKNWWNLGPPPYKKVFKKKPHLCSTGLLKPFQVFFKYLIFIEIWVTPPGKLAKSAQPPLQEWQNLHPPPSNDFWLVP